VTRALSDLLSLRLHFINLATKINSLARFSKRTLQPRKAVTTLSLLDFKSFNPLVRVLFSFPSRYLYAIGLKLLFRVGN
jgi:hypothetical protein